MQNHKKGKFPDLLFLQLLFLPSAFVEASLRKPMVSVQPERYKKNVYNGEDEITLLLQRIFMMVYDHKRLRWSRGSVLAFRTQVRGFKPGRSRRIFKGEKNPQHAFLRRGSKAVGPMS